MRDSTAQHDADDTIYYFPKLDSSLVLTNVYGDHLASEINFLTVEQDTPAVLTTDKLLLHYSTTVTEGF